MFDVTERSGVRLQHSHGVGAGCRTGLLLHGGSFHPQKTQNPAEWSLEPTAVQKGRHAHPARYSHVYCIQHTTILRYTAILINWFLNKVKPFSTKSC